MKTFVALILVSALLSFYIAAPTLASDKPLVGVKEGDWIEYNIGLTGTGISPPTHDVRWMRIEILVVQESAFSANVTTRYSNGSFGSAVWKFNFSEGNVGGWIIIPANLSPGDTFYDSSPHNHKPINVTIQRQEQKIVLGASRTVTYGNDSFRHKEWDKATGVFIGSSETLRNVTNKDGWYIENLTVSIQAIATNLWSPDSGAKPDIVPLLVVASIVLAASILSSVFVFIQRNRIKSLTFHYPSQIKMVVLTISIVTLVTVGGIFFLPFSEIGLSFAQINLIMQTFWTALVFFSMWLRLKGKYFIHELAMLAVICAWLVGFSAVLFMGPLSSSSLQTFSSTPLRLVMNSLHAIFSIPAIVFGIWLVALWRPGSISFVAKSRRVALLTAVFWMPSYIVGILDFMLLHTTFFG